ncbi:hypothetical protein C8Q73DRAFT_52191 [Cubamyces lactineus]|nr:hypothetical protein C8Q73DRAFT_52191 [Cubamyces lactineus]
MAGVIASSPSPVMSSNEQPRTPSPVPKREADVNADGASEIAQSDDVEAVAESEVVADPTFFENHLNSCPQDIVTKIEKRKDVKKALGAIDLVVSKDSEQKLYEPAATLLTAISKAILAHLKKVKKVDSDQRQIAFYDHHRHPLTHFPIPGRSEDYPDIVGVFEEPYGYEQREDDGTYRDIPYHRVETVVEAKAIYGADGKAQATRYAYKIQQARPDRPGYYVLSAKPQYFQVIFSSPVKPVASEHTRWNDLTALCAYVYSLYDPPDGHFLYDRTLSWVERGDQRFGRPSWTILTGGKVYTGAEACFLGDPWGRRTTVLRAESRTEPTVMFKEAYIDCDRRFNEADLLKDIHEDGYLPGAVFPISCEIVKSEGQEIVFRRNTTCGTLIRKKVRIVLADVGFDLFYAKSVNDLLMAIYDALEVHRTLAGKRRVLHRDMSIFNIMMYPILGRGADRRKYLQDCPPLIDEVLMGKARTPEKRRARCLIIDYDNSGKLTAGNASAIDQATLRCRTGTPSYIARAVCAGVVHSEASALSWEEQMPLLEGNARDLYIKVYGEERYNKYNDLSPDTVHGGIPPSRIRHKELQAKATAMPFYHRWEYDAESIFWTLYSALLRVTPVGFTEKPKDVSAVNLSHAWGILQKHIISNIPRNTDTRTPLLSNDRTVVLTALPPCMAPVGKLLLRIIDHVLPSYPLMDVLPPHDDHLHEAMERLILQYLVDNRDTPIPLIPHQLRPVYCPEPDVHAANRGTFGGSFHSFQSTWNSVPDASDARGQKRSVAPSDPEPWGVQSVPRHSDRLAKQRR